MKALDVRAVDRRLRELGGAQHYADDAPFGAQVKRRSDRRAVKVRLDQQHLRPGARKGGGETDRAGRLPFGGGGAGAADRGGPSPPGDRIGASPEHRTGRHQRNAGCHRAHGGGDRQPGRLGPSSSPRGSRPPRGRGGLLDPPRSSGWLRRRSATTTSSSWTPRRSTRSSRVCLSPERSKTCSSSCEWARLGSARSRSSPSFWRRTMCARRASWWSVRRVKTETITTSSPKPRPLAWTRTRSGGRCDSRLGPTPRAVRRLA